MKTAVSVPDDLFRQAEAAARRLRVSRCALYSHAADRPRDRAVLQVLEETLHEKKKIEKGGT